MTAGLSRIAAAVGLLLTLGGTPLQAAEPVSIQVKMPLLTCNKGILEHNECILTGTMRARGPETLNGPLRYYCVIRYAYVAAGNESQAIRFNGQLVHHGELTMVQGKGNKELSEQLVLSLSSRASQMDITDIGCERE